MNKVKKACARLTVLLTLAVAMLNANQDSYDYVPYEEGMDDNYNNSFCCDSSYRFSVRADALYWTPRITGLELEFGRTAITQEIIDGTQVLSTREVDLDPKFKWDAGYRVGAGFESNNLKAEALWTHFDGNGKRSSSNANTGKVKIKLDQLDLVLSYNTSPGCGYKLAPFIGARFTNIRTHINALLNTEITLSPISTALETRTFNDRQKYWGAGPLFGLQGDVEIGCGFGIYGTAAASLLYGDYKARFNDTDTYSAPISIQVLSRNKRHLHAFDYNIDLALGVSWHTCLCDQFELDLKLGFEQHQYFNQNRLTVGRGDVSFTGGVFSFELGF
jgi:hypothetical protein